MRRTRSMACTLAALAAMTACGATEDPTAAWTGDEPVTLIGPQLTVTFDLTGAITLAGEQTALATTNNGTLLKTCDEYAKGTDKAYYVGPGLFDGPVAGQKVTMEMWIKEYAGPGAYPKDQLVAPGSRPSIAVAGRVYGTWPDSTTSEVTTDGEGGGTWRFTALATTGEGGLPGDAVEGTVKWTCRNP